MRNQNYSFNFMKFILFTSLLLLSFYGPGVFGQEIPKGFRSVQEYEMINSPETDEFKLLLLLNDDISESFFLKSEKILDEFYVALHNENLDRYSESKKIKKLHAFVHDRFLIKYEEISPFHEIFESGTYNCVSATALIVLAMEELKIPYSIQELPTHVYVIAYPGYKDISIEMTDPKNGSFMPSRKDIGKTVNALLDFKLVSEQEVIEHGEREVYNRFFYRDQSISLRQLASLQFYNQAITFYEENRVDDAYNSIKKANILYGSKSDKSTFFQNEILIDFLEAAKFDKMSKIHYLVEYANLPNPNNEKVFYEYSYNVIQNGLIEGGKRSFVDSSYAYMQKHLKDTTLLKQISEVYYIGLSDYYASAYNLKKQLEYAELAYAINPNNVNTQSWLAKSIVRNLTEKYDDEEIVEEMEKEMESKPYLQTHNFFLMFYFYSCVEVSNDYYFNNDEELGKKYFDLAQNTMKKMGDPDVLNSYSVGMLYAEPGAYYIRHKDYEKALELLNEGLSLAEDHERILARIEIAEDRLENAPPRSERLKKEEPNDENTRNLIIIEEF